MENVKGLPQRISRKMIIVDEAGSSAGLPSVTYPMPSSEEEETSSSLSLKKEEIISSSKLQQSLAEKFMGNIATRSFKQRS